MSSFDRAHHFYLFAMKGGGKKFAYGASPQDALEVLSFWHTPEEMAQIIPDEYLRITQRELKQHAHELS